MIYVTSDIHGQYDMFIALLDKLKLKDSDTLYVLGDVVDRGPHGIKILQKLMTMPNVVCLVGNHELMALDSLKFLVKEITDETINEMTEGSITNILIWQRNGGGATINEIQSLDNESRQDIMDFLGDFSIYEELTIDGTDYLLVHAGLGNFSPDKDIEEYSLKELVWDRADYDITYYPDKYVVTGHTPTQAIPGNPNPGYIYRKNNHIAIDCGAFTENGRLAAICLNTGEEFYVGKN